MALGETLFSSEVSGCLFIAVDGELPECAVLRYDPHSVDVFPR